jgi:hypothetical protein
MPLTLLAELLEASRQARELAENCVDPQEKRRCTDLAVRWEEYAQIVVEEMSVRKARNF